MARYIWTPRTRNRLTARLHTLVDRINERPEIRTVHLLGYSFGALVALDTVYPLGLRSAALQQVSTLFTIGCPFDVVRMLNPSYAERRHVAVTGTGFEWTNIYEPIDVLASNFNDGDKVVAPSSDALVLADGSGRRPTKSVAWNEQLTLTLINFLMLRSVSIHSEYWDTTLSTRSALGCVVEGLYSGRPALR